MKPYNKKPDGYLKNSNARYNGLVEKQIEMKAKIFQYNHCLDWDEDKLIFLIRDILGKTGARIYVEPPFNCEYGKNIEVGNNFRAGRNLTVSGGGIVLIGDDVTLASNVTINAAGAGVFHDSTGPERDSGVAVMIGNNVRVGGNTTINSGVRIGDGTAIVTGSVVSEDIPSGCVASGNPCRFVHEMTDDDRKFYYGS